MVRSKIDHDGSSASPIFAGAILLLTCTLSLLWSHARLMWNDEFLSFYTDSVPTVRDVVNVQLHYPISLDPPMYHVLSHLTMDVFGRNAMSLRLPALVGFLLMQVSLFYVVRRLAGTRSALIAMALPLLTASFRYSVEGRPYALLLGLYGVALLCWQSASSAEAHQGRRWLSLTGLALAIALAITSHYFGVLILLPIGVGEAVRTVRRRRIDIGLIAAVLGGASALLLILPFAHALKSYRAHYYIQAVSWHNVTQGYRALFLTYTAWPVALQRLTAAVLTLAVITLTVAGFRRYKTRPPGEPAEVWAALATLLLLPFFGFLFGRWVTHTMEVRYVIAALLPFAAVIGILLETRLSSNGFFYRAMAGILGAALLINLSSIGREHRDSQAILSSFELSPAASALLGLQPRERIFIQTLNEFFLDTYYEPDATLRSRFSYLFGREQEIQWFDRDTNAVTAENMQHFAPLSVTPYTIFLRQREPLLMLHDNGWEWVGKDLSARGASFEMANDALRGKLVRVRVP